MWSGVARCDLEERDRIGKGGSRIEKLYDQKHDTTIDRRQPETGCSFCVLQFPHLQKRLSGCLSYCKGLRGLSEGKDTPLTPWMTLCHPAPAVWKPCSGQNPQTQAFSLLCLDLPRL